MLDPSWAIRTPEANDLLFKSGPGIGSMLTALAGYTAEMASTETAAGVSTANMAALNTQFQGATNVASTTTVTGLNTIAHLLFGWLAEKPPVITAAVNAYTTAYSAMVPAALCQLNRDEWAIFNALNIAFPGMFLAEVVDRDREYFGNFWPNNSSTGTTYAAALTALMPALAIPPPITPPGASPDMPAAAAAAVAQSATTGAAGDAMRASSEAAGQVISSGQSGAESFTDIAQKAMQPLQQGLDMVPKAFETVAGMPEKMLQPAIGMMQNFNGMMGGAFKGAEAAPASATDALRSGGTGAPSSGLGPTAGSGAAGLGGVGGAGAQGLTSYTRPVSSFAPENGGRPSGLRNAGLLNATELRGPTTGSGMGGAAMPMSQAGMLARQQGEGGGENVTRARIVVGGDHTDKE